MVLSAGDMAEKQTGKIPSLGVLGWEVCREWRQSKDA